MVWGRKDLRGRGQGAWCLGCALFAGEWLLSPEKVLPRNPFEMPITYANSFYMLKKFCRESPLQGFLGRISILLSVVLRLR